MSGVARRRSRTVMVRVLLSYAIVMTAFAIAAGWSVMAQRSSAKAASLMRNGYLPLALSLRDLVANQDTWNTQLNHITSALNPADKRVWFETALRIGRPKKTGEVRARISHAFLDPGDPAAHKVGEELLSQTHEVEAFLAEDRDLVKRIFSALDNSDAATAEHLRDQLVTRGFQARKLLSRLEQRVGRQIDLLLDETHQRERRGTQLLIVLIGLTLVVGLLVALYARRVLRPLTLVTERAKAVAEGDLTPRGVVESHDEIGELASTFEGMVAAIKRANEQLLATERLATIGKMAAHVTHEIRNPLSSIALNMELLEEELDNPAEARALLRAMGKEVDRLAALSGQYLSMAKRRDYAMEEENVDRVVREACDFMRGDLERQGVTLDVNTSPAGHLVLADEAELKQALYNLIRNARDAMAEGGRVTVSTVREDDSWVEIRVEDEGSGIDERARDKLFDPFFSTKSHGTGLGLAITRQIVVAHQGTIACQARAEGGTRFVVRLPSAPSAKSPRPPPEIAPASPLT